MALREQHREPSDVVSLVQSKIERESAERVKKRESAEIESKINTVVAEIRRNDNISLRGDLVSQLQNLLSQANSMGLHISAETMAKAEYAVRHPMTPNAEIAWGVNPEDPNRTAADVGLPTDHKSPESMLSMLNNKWDKSIVGEFAKCDDYIKKHNLDPRNTEELDGHLANLNSTDPAIANASADFVRSHMSKSVAANAYEQTIVDAQNENLALQRGELTRMANDPKFGLDTDSINGIENPEQRMAEIERQMNERAAQSPEQAGLFAKFKEYLNNYKEKRADKERHEENISLRRENIQQSGEKLRENGQDLPTQENMRQDYNEMVQGAQPNAEHIDRLNANFVRGMAQVDEIEQERAEQKQEGLEQKQEGLERNRDNANKTEDDKELLLKNVSKITSAEGLEYNGNRLEFIQKIQDSNNPKIKAIIGIIEKPFENEIKTIEDAKIIGDNLREKMKPRDSSEKSSSDENSRGSGSFTDRSNNNNNNNDRGGRY